MYVEKIEGDISSHLYCDTKANSTSDKIDDIT